MEEGPVKISAAELGLLAREDVDTSRYEFDLGNLCVSDPSPVDGQALAKDKEAACSGLATSMVQALVNSLFELPSEPADVGRLVELPAPSTRLPREKPIPKPKPPTKWELFAERKGIVKRKRSKLVLDEASDTFKRRYGYKRANDESAIPVIEARPNEEPGSDPFTEQRKAKKERVAKQEKARLANLQHAVEVGGKRALPPTLRLAASLPEHGRGKPIRSRDFKNEVWEREESALKETTKQASISTASLGRYDRVVRGEKMADRKLPGKKKALPPLASKNAGERAAQTKLVDHILRRNADDILDVGRAIGKFEAEAREERHRLKNKGANKKGRGPKGASGGVAKKGAAPRKGKGGAKGGAKGGPAGKGGKRK
ncbi:hypothetical protein QBZ16_000173 [Prototheca wickerhamii]|uniref:Ribosome biogenesis regulatory protein n=1 Tax=Prototheca wickerhamii TaxID=3111 RepID=A0AAD9IMS9_PROWI|nr:hypothetical protein QBZ16_000173 [Prototheca wickerhamii]